MPEYIPPYLCAPNYARPAFAPQLKTEPRVVAKVKKARAVAKMDRTEKEDVRKRDKESCRVCGRRSREVHERLFKSLGGVASRRNSLVLCRKCHTYAHAHGLKVIGGYDGHTPNCDNWLTFQMCEAVARDIFRGRALPKHCEIVAVKRGQDGGREG